ncbi:MAG TPA: hypothetical protein VET65_14595 [Candidatus Limnocylindrales bacterium]|nr:hypothetical protein [Candidatus Limnocylindrales bacterium]
MRRASAIVTGAALLIAAMLLAACGSSTSGSSSSAGGGDTTATQPNQGEAAGGEAGVVHWQDPQHRYTIDSPGAMTVAADGSAAALRPEERLQVAIVTGSAAADPMALAQADLSTLRSTATNFRLLSGPATVTIGGRQMVKALYQWTAGTNPVTGKATNLASARYYIPRDGSRLAVVTYGIAVSQYDPQGADDEAISFTWLS